MKNNAKITMIPMGADLLAFAKSTPVTEEELRKAGELFPGRNKSPKKSGALASFLVGLSMLFPFWTRS